MTDKWYDIWTDKKLVFRVVSDDAGSNNFKRPFKTSPARIVLDDRFGGPDDADDNERPLVGFDTRFLQGQMKHHWGRIIFSPRGQTAIPADQIPVNLPPWNSNTPWPRYVRDFPLFARLVQILQDRDMRLGGQSFDYRRLEAMLPVGHEDATAVDLVRVVYLPGAVQGGGDAFLATTLHFDGDAALRQNGGATGPPR
jgi:hypothetical protein